VKLKLNEQGFAVVVDGKPVYVHDDGKEIPTDVPGLVQTINRVNGEAKAHRLKAEEYESKIKPFEGLDPEAARKALETVSNLDAKKLIDAGEVERVKGETAKAYEERLRTMGEQAKAIQAERDALKGTLDGERIANAFAKSKFIAEKLAVPLDMVQAAFGSRFKADDDGVFAYDANGNKMISRQRPGEYATFDEAVELLVEAYPHRDSILKGSGASGGGAPGSGGASGGKVVNRQQFESMDASARASFLKSGGKLTD
jgi:hypothetical protein